MQNTIWHLSPKPAQILRTARHSLELSSALLIWSGTLSLCAQGNMDVVTYHNDLARSGQNLNETILTPANVNPKSFAKLFSYPVDGYVYAQPLYMADLSIPGKGRHNVVFVATEHDSVYAFDADSNLGDSSAPLWRVSFIDREGGVSTVPISDYALADPPEIGITGTPVIDPSSGTLFVVAKIKDSRGTSPRYANILYALDLTTGQTKFGGPVEIQASAPGTGVGTDGQGNIPFDPFHGFQRPGLLLLNGVVYIAFASAGDEGPYHGWIMGYDAHSLQQVQLFDDTPDGYGAGIWMSGGALAADSAGEIYCMTGNGTFDRNIGGRDFGDSFLKLRPSGGRLDVADYFTPYDQDYLNSVDGDLGSGGPLLLPDSVAGDAHPHLMVGCGKEGIIYLLDRDNMGQFNPNDNSQIVQSFPASGTWSMPAYFKNLIYFGGVDDFLKAYSISNGVLSSSPVSHSETKFGYPGPTPSISADGTNNAIVWIVQADAFGHGGPAVLRAYNATNLAEELYSSAGAGARDQLGLAQKFSVPTIANGKVYVGVGFGLSVFGISMPQPRLTINPQLSITIQGEPGQTYFIEYAAGLDPGRYDWMPLTTLTLTDSTQTLIDPEGTNQFQRFYRAIAGPF